MMHYKIVYYTTNINEGLYRLWKTIKKKALLKRSKADKISNVDASALIFMVTSRQRETNPNLPTNLCDISYCYSIDKLSNRKIA